MKLLLLFFAAAALARQDQILLASASSQCTEHEIPVSVQRTTETAFSGQSHSVQVLFSLAEKHILVSNNYTLSARLCLPPSEIAVENAPLQLLLHGATFSKNMWDVSYQPENYSYVRHMTAQGYPTLSLDLIGAGNSSYPDALLEAQTQTYIETVAIIVQQLRDGSLLARKWDKIVIVGFSIGAIIANSLVEQKPDAIDAIIFHGITWDLSWLYPAFLFGLQGPAPSIDPDRWGHLEPFYQTQSTREGRLAACFYGKYDTQMVEYDWNTRDVDSLGAAITFAYHLVVAPKFTGPVFLGIGEEDSTFCGGKKCEIQPYTLYSRFPRASAHEVKVYPDTGHAVLYHHSAKALMEDSLAFLKSNGF